MNHLEIYWKILQAWLSSSKVSIWKAIEYAAETVAAVEALPKGPVSVDVVLAILLGVITGTYQHDPVTSPDGTVTHPAGPVATPAHAVALAYAAASKAEEVGQTVAKDLDKPE